MLKRSAHDSKSFVREVFSPDQRLCLTFRIVRGAIYYEVAFDGRPLIHKSTLGFLIFGENPLGTGLKILRTTVTKHTETIEMPWGDTKYIDNTYNEASFHLEEFTKLHRHFTLRFRIFNNAVAFRYELPVMDHLRFISIKDELTEFNIGDNSTCWSIPAFEPDRYEYNYEKRRLRDLNHPVHTPLTIKHPSGTYLSIHEAALYDYGSMTIEHPTPDTLKANITPLSDGSKAHLVMPFSTPWRLIMVASSAAELTENHTMYALNPAPSQDFSWVQTLKFLGIWWAMYVGEWTWAPGEKHGATTLHAKEYIDAAVRLGLKGLLIEGWNDGWEGNWLDNGATTDFIKGMTDFNLDAVAAYAYRHGIELIGHHETVGFIDNYEAQLERAYNYYATHHIHYVKTGYAGSRLHTRGHTEYHHSQIGVRHYQKTVELAAKKHICLDIHEPIKGTGIERTFPNLLSREGARGQEYEGGALAPSHACILPYTRLLAGGMDYTPGIFDLQNPKKTVRTTIIRQLAYFVVIYSGMLMAADRPVFYDRYPDLFNFIRSVPTDYEFSLPLAGEIGEYYLIARKSRETPSWFLGGVTSERPRRLTVKLDFLDPDTTYRAHIYADAPDASFNHNPFAYHVSHRQVKHSDELELFLAPGGGVAIEFIK